MEQTIPGTLAATAARGLAETGAMALTRSGYADVNGARHEELTT
jgi:hypothetical protein